MRARNNKLINFILEISQVLLVFLGVYSALMCTASSLELSYDRLMCVVILLFAAILFYGLFTVLETFHNGKLYGVLGLTLFGIVIVIRFLGAMRKGFVTIINSFLKEFMNYSGSSLTLMSYTDTESASVKFCTTFILILLGVYLTALISAFFYRRRRPMVFSFATLPFVVLPLMVGRLGYFSNLLTYLVVLITVVGTRHLKTDATDRRMRQKLSILLVSVGLVSGLVSYIVMPPARYESRQDDIVRTRNTLIALTQWESDEIFAWIKAYFNDDAIDYGKLGKKSEITYNGETMLKISGNVFEGHGIYLKGYVGDVYEDSRWSSLQGDEEYKTDLALLEGSNLSPDNWHVQLRNELGDNETSGLDLWNTEKLRIRNIAFGYGNYLVPYLPTSEFKYEEDGKSTIKIPGIDYTVEYYNVYPVFMRNDMSQQSTGMANTMFWDDNKDERQRMKAFAEKYYMQVPDSLSAVCEEFKGYLDKKGNALKRFQDGKSSVSRMIHLVKQYVVDKTEYSLAPGKTPSGVDTVEYFLNDGKKGYCTYYATAAAILLRSCGIPTRYVEGMYVSGDELKECSEDKEVAVPDKDAHAWVEVYDDKYGFVPMEFTPGFGEDAENAPNTENGEPDTDDSDNTSEESDSKEDDKSDPATPTPSVTETPEESMTFEDIEREEEKEEQESGQNSGFPGNIPGWLWVVIEVVAGILLVALAMEIQRRVRRRIFKRSMSSMRMKRRIRMVHHHLAPIFARRGVSYRGQTMAEYAGSIAEVMEMPEAEVYEYVSLVFYARFGPDTITEEDLKDFQAVYEEIRTKAYKDAKLLRKLYYMYIMVL